MLRKRTTIAAAVAVSAGLGVGAVAITADGDEQPRIAMPSDEIVAVPKAPAILAPEVEDPRGGPAWAIVEYAGPDGRVCSKPGQREGDRVGVLNPDGKIVGTDPAIGADCVLTSRLPDAEPVSYQISTQRYDARTGEKDVVSYIWGVARDDVRRLDIATNAGERSVELRGRAFIVTVPGHAAVDPVRFTATLTDGATREFASQRPPEEIRQRMLNPPEGEDLLRDLREHGPETAHGPR